MITPVSIIACLLTAVSMALSQDATTDSFNVSLSTPHTTDLSAVYRQVIRGATDAYRGDLPDYSRFATDALVALAQRPNEFDPFSHIALALRVNTEEPPARE